MSEHRHHHHHHHHSQRTSSLTGDEKLDRDIRRQQYRRIAMIMPGVILAIGLAVWSFAAGNDETTGLNSYRSMQNCGIVLMAFGGGILLLMLLAEWGQRIRKAIRDHASRHSHHHHHHHRHHHHHHGEGDGTTEEGSEVSPALPDADDKSEKTP